TPTSKGQDPSASGFYWLLLAGKSGGRDIRDTKTELELRPVFHMLGDRVMCHAFVCLLAQYVRWHIFAHVGPRVLAISY
ncbi:MAG: hypothetical protein AB1449_13475, partial [Chloroflexota bacterium]